MGEIKRVDHIAIAVKSIDASRPLFESLYGAKFLLRKENLAGKYEVAYFQLGENIITLLEGTEPDSFVSKHVEQRGEGIQHVGLEVDNLNDFLANLEEKGARVSNKLTLEGIRKEALISPRSAFGLILQPIEWLGELRNLPPSERVLKAGGN
ncbi:MAG: VOC family protein [Chloroflexi bacterium]|nr:VOC family protein [Chloroflexota bacterium]